MASSSSLQVQYLLSLFLFVSSSLAQPSFRPKALVLPVTKDSATLEYTTKLNQRTPLVSISLVLDLGGQYLWVDCEQNFFSSTKKPTRCNSTQCSLSSLARSPPCGDNNTCLAFPDNTIAPFATNGEVASDVISLQSTNGFNPGPVVTARDFIFGCAPSFLLDTNLTKGVVGFAGLGRTKISLPTQFSTTFNFTRKFALCLPSNSNSKGVVLFGDGPYTLLPNVDASQSLTYTPLIINRVSTANVRAKGEPSSEYFIGVTSIKVNNKVLSLNKTLLSINKQGNGGTKISTVQPYSYLEESIYKALTKSFAKELASMKIARVNQQGVPFEYCYSTRNVTSTRLGYGVPTIELVLQNESTVWRIYGANSMVTIGNEVMCLGILNAGGGELLRTSIVIGGHQLEDNLLQFDLASSKARLGFSSLLYGRRTTCSNFNFTSTA